MMKAKQIVAGAAVLVFALTSAASAARIKDLCEVQGARPNPLKGYGLVIGLAGTGDNMPEAVLAQQRVLKRLDVDIASLGSLSSENAAVVIVTAEFPAFAKEGTRIDVQVSSIGDAESLEGGVLLNTQLTGDNGRVYAVAQGPISVGGLAAGGAGASVQRNHPTVGRIPLGGYIEREIPSTVTDGERFNLLVKRPDFQTATNIAEALNEILGAGHAKALGAGSINVRIPEAEQADWIGFIAKLQDINVDVGLPARVVINERTGTIVVGGDVAVRPVQVAHGNITIETAVRPVLPPPPLIGQEERVAEMETVEVTEEGATLADVSGTTASEVALALNKLKVTPRDMISIFQALSEAGALDADIEIM